MTRRKGFLLLAVVVFAMVSSSSSNAESVEFLPKKDETRSYQLFSHGLMLSGDSHHGYSQDLQANAVLNVEVLEADDTLRLAITPRYLQHLVDGMQEFSSMDLPEHQSSEVSELMTAGFENDS